MRSDVLLLAGVNSFAGASQDLLANISPGVGLLSGDRRRSRDSSSPDLSSEMQIPALRVFRTQRDGAVTVVIKGREIAVRPYWMVAGEGTAGFNSAASLTSSSFRVR
jgi:beta-lactamase superfamily II metal-dependent hydrolase